MLSERGKQVRRDTIKLSGANGGYHYGGCFSAVEILTTLFDSVLTEEDRFILSKGHACWPYYVLLRERGLNPKLSGHPCRDCHNGVLCSTGSLGHGLPTGIGIALAKKVKGEKGKVYVLVGDGECQEGTTWESFLIAAHHKLDNLVVIVDFNRIQGSGFTNDILFLSAASICNIAKDLGWFGRIADGHDEKELKLEFLSYSPNKPSLIIAKTVKGKGVSFMEDDPKWHANWLDKDHEKAAIEELSKVE
jgi:transketolase